MSQEKTKLLLLDPHFHLNGDSGNEEARKKELRRMFLSNERRGIEVVVATDHQDRQLVDPFSKQEQDWRDRLGIKQILVPGVEIATKGELSTNSISTPAKPTTRESKQGIAHWLVISHEPAEIREFIGGLEKSTSYPKPKEMLDLLSTLGLYTIVAHPNPDVEGLDYQKEKFSAHLWLIAAAQEYLDKFSKRGQKNSLIGLEINSGYQSEEEIESGNPIKKARTVFAEEHDLLKFGGSDAHNAEGVGQSFTVINYEGERPTNAEQIINLMLGTGDNYKRRSLNPKAGSHRYRPHGLERLEQAIIEVGRDVLTNL